LIENFSRDLVATDLVASLTTAVMTSVAIPLQGGDVITSLSFLSGATAGGTLTNEWVALYSSAATPALLGQSVTVTTAWAADTFKTFTLAAPIAITSTGVYYAALMVAATTVPTLMGRTTARAAVAGALITGMPILSQTSGSALAATAPGTIASPTTVATIPYCVAQ
jgi:hypothetical protein